MKMKEIICMHNNNNRLKSRKDTHLLGRLVLDGFSVGLELLDGFSVGLELLNGLADLTVGRAVLDGLLDSKNFKIGETVFNNR